MKGWAVPWLRSLVLVVGLLAGGLVPDVRAQRLSALGEKPDWSRLEAFQETITRADFVRLLDTVYAPGGAAKGLIEVEAAAAVIRTTLVPAGEFRLRFAAEGGAVRPVPRAWRPASALPPAPEGKPLTGVKIALDAGHLGGAWAKMEERFFQVGESRPVIEGEMTLRVAKLLAPKLRELGAEVVNLRETAEPTTALRPETLRESALAELAKLGVAAPREKYDGTNDPGRAWTVQAQSELLFYRIAEIRERAALVNAKVKPDLVVCLHFNAEGWGDPLKPEFVPRNHLHVLVNGCYAAGELRYDDQRFEMLLKLLSRTYDEELAASEPLATALAAATQLPPYEYTTGSAVHTGATAYVWARNLLANRLYHAPVAFLEPYVMNSEAVWMRVQAGDYDGEITLAGAPRRSLFREYADAVAEGLRAYYEKARAEKKPAAPGAPASP
ncbi:MAG: N-acetylmuramoyl-L-alanine amidase [Chthoniobacter sp.]|nr:N-acetylmuramoyl-L-alanine amidase [Chthoniobacter sp.]